MMTETTSVLIVGNGTSPGPRRLRDVAAGYSTIFAADGGLATLAELDLEASLVIGDFDSVEPALLARVSSDIRQLTDQYTTDLEKAIVAALEQGAHRIGLACVTGDRLDHTINAVSLMVRYRDRADLVLYDAAGEARLVVPPGLRLEGKVGDKLSLLPAPGARGVTSRGLTYPLDRLDLLAGGRDGISNEFSAPQAEITFESGSLLVYLQRPVRPQ